MTSSFYGVSRLLKTKMLSMLKICWKAQNFFLRINFLQVIRQKEIFEGELTRAYFLGGKVKLYAAVSD